MRIGITDIENFLAGKLNSLLGVTSLSVYDYNASPEQVNQLFQHCAHIPSIEFRHFEIAVIPDFSTCIALEYLRISCPKMTGFPEQNFPKSLKRVFIEESDLQNVPDTFWQLENLSEVHWKSPAVTELFVPGDSNVRTMTLNFPNLKKLTFGTRTEPNKNPGRNFGANLSKGIRSLLGYDDPENPSRSINALVNDLRLYAKNLKELDKSFSNLTELTRLTVHAPIEKVHCDFSPLKNLSEIHFHQWNLSDFTFLKNLTGYIRFLEIAYPARTWKNFPDMRFFQNLQRLWITGCSDKELCSRPVEFPNLIQLYLKECKFENIFENLAKTPKLGDVQLTGALPVNFADCMRFLLNARNIVLNNVELNDLDAVAETELNWQYLTFNNNSTKFDHFNFASKMPKLTSVSIRQNDVSSPLVLLREKTFPLEQFQGEMDGFKFKNLSQYCRLASAIARSGLSRVDQEYFANHFARQLKMTFNKKWDLTMLLKASNISMPTFKKRWQAALDEKIAETEIPVTVKEDSVVYITGKPPGKKTEIKKTIQALGAKYAPKFVEEVTHVIVGYKSPDYDLLADKMFIPVTVAHLQQQVADSKPQFLTAAAAGEGGDEMMKNLSALLKSGEEESIMVALEMIKAGGLPPQVVEPLLVVQKTTSNSNIRKKTKELLEVHAPIEWKPILRDRLSFKAVYDSNKSEVDIRRQFRALAKRVPPVLAGKFSRLLFRQTGRGLRYALTAGLAKSEKLKAYELLYENKHFDFSKGLGFSEKDSFNNYYTPEMSVALPVVALELGAIESLNLSNCRYHSIDAKIKKFKDLKFLDFSKNELSKLPDFLPELMDLETLDLSENEFRTFPEILLKMSNLSLVNLRDNPDFEMQKSIDLKQLGFEVRL